MESLNDKFSTLKRILGSCKSVLVAFSGGVDSAFLAKAAYDVLGDRALAVTVRSKIHPAFEEREARQIAQAIGVRHLVIDADPLAVPHFAENPPERCYVCKREILSTLKAIAAREGLEKVVEGSNASDTGDYRPGMKAVKELRVASPLMEAGLTKDEIRELSRRAGLATWDKPSYACLASRIPYGEEITEEKLAAVEAAEDYLREKGYRVLRVRHHGAVARIELAPEELKAFIARENTCEVARAIKAMGFSYVALDLDGYRTGSLNEPLAEEGINS